MASGVRILPEQVVNQIAAGEVVERPASVIKELVENALDAGATIVSIHLRDGGRERIRVEDNGRGMGEQDALMCIERHATSKIRAAEDLQRISTLGFRGEALPSIAAVSRFELTTRTATAGTATRVRIEGGRLTDVREVAGPNGTIIDVRSLFYNLPARRAFLRTRATELGHCIEAVVRQAVLRPDVDFTVRHGERQLVRAPATGDPQQRAADLLGPDARRLVEVDAQVGELHVIGLAAPAGVHRATANGAWYLYVNGRFVRDPVVRRALRQGYRDLVPSGRTPIVVCNLDLAPDRVDVNVHPTKSEVRFHDPRGVTEALATAIREAVLAGGADPTTQHRAVRGGALRSSEPSLPFIGAPPPWTDPLPGTDGHPSWVGEPSVPPLVAPGSRPEPVLVARPVAGSLEVKTASATAPEPLRALRVLGVAHGRHVVLESSHGLTLLDAGRLARRVACAGPLRPQRLLAPVAVSVGEAASARLASAESELLTLGLDILRFSGREWAVKSVPESLADVDPEILLELTIDALANGTNPRSAWGAGVPPLVLDPSDLHAVKVLLATAEELGLSLESDQRRLSLDGAG